MNLAPRSRSAAAWRFPSTLLSASLSAVVCIGLWLAPGCGSAQTIDQNLWVTNGAVNTMVRNGTTLYLGGTFTEVGPSTGYGVPINTTSGSPVTGFPKVNGLIYAVVSDSTGGWYIGGTFTQVGGYPRLNIAYILANDSVSTWNPGANSNVRALLLSGANLYAGGDFTIIGGQGRNRIAALEANTGITTGWNPNANSTVMALALSGSTVYVGGDFTNIGGATRNRIAALSLSTGLASSWNPNADNAVMALAVSGTTVYAGGDFTNIGGQPRNHVAGLATGTGLANAWNPNANGQVSAIVVSGTTVYMGGQFNTIAGQSRSYIAAVATSGIATAWNPNADSAVPALALVGSTMYAGGYFTTIGGQARSHLAALSTATGLATAWNPSVNSTVWGLAVRDPVIYAGGDFTSVGSVRRRFVAALDATSGTATAWNPTANSVVNALAMSGTILYAGGGFTNIGGQPRNRIAALDTTTGAAYAWNPNANGAVSAVAVSGTSVFVGGSFTTVSGLARNRIAALDSKSGLANAWNPNSSGTVSALAVNGPIVYAGGLFSTIGGQSRSNIAALVADTLGGFATSWNPSANNSVLALVPNGATVLAGGAFTNIGGQTRNRIAALDTTSGAANSWNPNANLQVFALAVSGPTVYAGGSFSNIGGRARNRIAALDAVSGVATAWNPNSDDYVNCLALSPTTVYAGGQFIGFGGSIRSRLAAMTATPAISSIAPARGGNTGAVTVTVIGSGLPSGASITLSRIALPNIPATNIAVAADGLSLVARFDLNGAATGVCDVVVTTPDAQRDTLYGAFTIDSIAAPQLRVNVIGPPTIRANRRTAFDLVIENAGNVDALDVPLWLSGVPADATLELDFPLAYPPQAGGEPNWAAVPLGFTSPGGRYLDVVIPRVPPGTVVRRVYLTVPATDPTFKLRAAVTPPWADGVVFDNCLANGGISNTACMGGQLTAIHAYLAANSTIAALSGIGVWAKVAWNCEAAGTLPAALVKAEQVLDFMAGPVESPAVALTACSDVLPPRWRDSLTVTIVSSLDPNEKLGSRDSISLQQPIPYSIRFENASTATAPAQQVIVSDPLNLSVFDVSTLSLDMITFGNVRILPPPGLHNFSTTVDLRPGNNLIVDVGASLDLFGVLSWYFRSIDPGTMQPTTDPLAGFLPPGGEGSVLFTVMPRPTLSGGTQIHNSASITFDENAAVGTPPWSNTIDNVPPSSHVLPLAANSDLSSITVQWMADGAPQDLRDFTVYVVEDNASPRVWRLDTRATADTLRPPGNHLPHTYAFYSVARDLAGNIEPPPAAADATTQSRVAVEGAASLQLALEGARPNPARVAMRVWFTLPSPEPATLELIDIAGRRVSRTDVGAMGPGRHAVPLATSPPLRPGLYFIRLTQSARTLSARVALIR